MKNSLSLSFSLEWYLTVYIELLSMFAKKTECIIDEKKGNFC